MKHYHTILWIVILYNSFIANAQTILPIKINKKWGLIDEEGKIIRNPFFDSIYFFEKYSYCYAFKDKKTIILNKKGQIVFESENQNFDLDFTERFQRLRKNNLYGLFDLEKKKWIIPAAYNEINWYSEQNKFAIVKKDSLYGLFDLKKKKLILHPIYNEIDWQLEQNKIIRVKKDSLYGLFDLENEKFLLLIDYNNIYIYSDLDGKKFASVKKGSLIGIFNLEKKDWLIPPVYQGLYKINSIGKENFYILIQNHKNIIFDGQKIIPTPPDLQDFPFDYVDEFNKDFLILIKNYFSNENFIFRMMNQYDYNKKFVFRILNKNNFEKIIDCQLYYSVDNNVTFVQNNEKKWGILNKKGKMIEPFIYQDFGNDNEKIYVAQDITAKKYIEIKLNKEGEIEQKLAFQSDTFQIKKSIRLEFKQTFRREDYNGESPRLNWATQKLNDNTYKKYKNQIFTYKNYFIDKEEKTKLYGFDSLYYHYFRVYNHYFETGIFDDNNQKIIVPPLYDNIQIVNTKEKEIYFIAKKVKKWKYFDNSKEIINHYQIFDKIGNIIIDGIYTNVGVTKDEFLWLETKENMMYYHLGKKKWIYKK